MVVAGDFKNGITFDDGQGNVLQVIEFQHVKPGKGAAFVRTKLKNVISGAVIEKTFNPTDKFENAYIERKDMQYSYDDGDLYHFMDTETWEETLIPIYLYTDDATRLERAIGREKQQARPNYREVCRRFLADEEDFSEEKLRDAHITKRYENNAAIEDCIEEIAQMILKTQTGPEE